MHAANYSKLEVYTCTTHTCLARTNQEENPAQDLTEQTSKWLKEVSLRSYNKNKMKRPKNQKKKNSVKF